MLSPPRDKQPYFLGGEQQSEHLASAPTELKAELYAASGLDGGPGTYWGLAQLMARLCVAKELRPQTPSAQSPGVCGSKERSALTLSWAVLPQPGVFLPSKVSSAEDPQPPKWC